MQTAAEALSLVRKRAPFTETIYSLYVTDKERHLTGILSLRDLVLLIHLSKLEML